MMLLTKLFKLASKIISADFLGMIRLFGHNKRSWHLEKVPASFQFKWN